MVASRAQSEILQCGTSDSKLPFQKRATGFQLHTQSSRGCLEAAALSPICPRAEFRRPCVAEPLKGHSMLSLEGEALLGSQMRAEKDLAPHAADVLQTSESLR